MLSVSLLLHRISIIFIIISSSSSSSSNIYVIKTRSLHAVSKRNQIVRILQRFNIFKILPWMIEITGRLCVVMMVVSVTRPEKS
jgi:hypothetical protein